MSSLRNICIIAHVDHGKTTLVDHMLRQAGTFQSHEEVTDRVMDSMDLERERGITILAKNTAIQVGDTRINVVDTPGHADFGGEVERILGMVDGAFLLVDAAEGPLPQTRFVLQKALTRGLRVGLVINKVDRPELESSTRMQDVINETFDLFVELGATEDQLEFPIIYACAREGWCTADDKEIESLKRKEKTGTLEPLMNLILEWMPEPKIDDTSEFKILVSNLTYSEYVGRLALGRALSGSVKKGQKIFRKGVHPETKAEITEPFTVTKVYRFEGLKQTEVEELVAGDIGVIAGTEKIQIGDTLSSDAITPPLPRITVDPPTLAMIFSINTSPLSGQDGEAVQSRKLRERLLREVRQNVALRLEDADSGDQFRMMGRGELQFAILIEQMRREGLEFMVGKPIVLYQEDENGQKLEPMEKVTLDLPEEFTGDATQLFQQRKGVLIKYEPSGKNRVQLQIEIPTRGLLGLRSKYLSLTRGMGLLSSILTGYAPHKGQLLHRSNGALVSDRNGKAVEYALFSLEERGILFVRPGDAVYEGLVIGESKIENDLNVNPTKEKKLTNMRSANADILVTLKGSRDMSLEQSIEWIDEDEWIEITPSFVRIRKKVLQAQKRSVKRSSQLGL
jgi:GTP-binding protein